MASMDVETFMGSFFILLCITFILYGFFCAQVYYYYATYQDRCVLKFVVFVLCVLESVHVASCVHLLYSYLLVDYANSQKVLGVVWSAGFIFYLEHTIGVLVQTYYISRVWCVSQNRYIIFALAAVESTRIAIGFKASSYVCMYNTWATMRAETMFGIYLNMAFGFNIFVDLSIAAILTFYLNAKGRSVACGQGTKKVLLRLVYYAITAGALTVLVNIAVLISYNKSMHTLTYAGLLQIIAKLNANSMVAMLNARKTIAGATITAAGVPVELSRLSSRRPAQPPASIHVFQETIVIEEKWNAGEEGQQSKPSIQNTVSQMSSYREATASV